MSLDLCFISNICCLHLLFRTALRTTGFLVVLLLPTTLVYGQKERVQQLLYSLQQPQPDTTRLNTLVSLSKAYSTIDPRQTFYYAQQFGQLAKKIGNYKRYADSYVMMGNSYGVRSRYDSAFYCYTISLAEARKINYGIGIGDALINMGMVYNRLDDDQHALEHFQAALGYFRDSDYPSGVNMCVNNIGSLYFDQKEYQLALTYYLRTLDYYTSLSNPNGRAYAYYNVGSCYELMLQHAKALDYYQAGMSIRDSMGNLAGLATVSAGIGRIYSAKGNDSAGYYLLHALALSQKVQDKDQEAGILNDLAQHAIRQKKMNDAEQYALKSLSIAQALRSKLLSVHALSALSQVYLEKKNTAKALLYQTAYIRYRDSLYNEAKLKELSLLELGRMQEENGLLQEANKRSGDQLVSKNAQLKRYSYFTVVFSIIFLLVLVIIYLLYRSVVDKKSNNRLLMQQNEKIESANHELSALNEEIVSQMELLQQQNLQLEKLDGIKNKLFSIVSHDVRSPLASLFNLLQLFEAGRVSADEMKYFMHGLSDNVNQLSSFLDSLLQWARTQMGGLAPKPVRLDMHAIARDTILLLQQQAGTKGIRLLNEMPDNVFAFADEEMIKTVIRNLISNSIKFSAEGDGIRLGLEQPEVDKVVVSIEDTGTGISPEVLKKLFTYEHYTTKGTSRELGTGLGLILCKELLELNNGSIWVESEPGKGAVFYFSIPSA